ncbi:MAG: Rrf2 family transcriptional regulator [Parvularculaceae bacterium]|nr:Rrf2 family transcriptional regulator [Parvularculaceae bacterium]
MYGKQTETAIAALTSLAEVYDGGKTRLSAAQIAQKRGLQGPSVAKSLTTLSQAGLVQGIPGPGGGYWLAREPDQITLHDAYRLFEREDTTRNCPFGGGTCGSGDPCPIHKKLIKVQEAVSDLLRGTTLQVFHDEAQNRTPGRPDDPDLPPARETFRANHARKTAS